MKHNNAFKDLQKKYEDKQKTWKMRIRLKPKKSQRFWGWVWYLVAFPFVWLFYNIRDWRTLVIFVIVVLVVGIEVWLPILLGFITWGTTFSKVMFGVAGTCELFWLGPGTPFIIICTGITIAVKGAFNKISAKIKNKRAIAKHPKE